MRRSWPPSIELDEGTPKVRGPILQEFWHNFTHNLFKPLLLFFYLGFLVPILKVEFEFPYVIYQGLTIYLLLPSAGTAARSWPRSTRRRIKNVAGFMLLGFVLNFFIGIVAYLVLTAMTTDAPDRQGDGGRLLRLGLGGHVRDLRRRAGDRRHGVQRLHAGHAGRHGDPGLPGGPVPGRAAAAQGDGRPGQHARRAGLRSRPPGRSPPYRTGTGTRADEHEQDVEQELELSLEKREHPDHDGGNGAKKAPIISRKLLHEVFLNPGLYLLFGGIIIGLRQPVCRARR